MITPEKIDNIKNLNPHLSEQQITDMLMRSKEENLKSLYPNLTADQINEFLKDKPESVNKPISAPTAKKRAARAKRLAASKKGVITKAANLAAKTAAAESGKNDNPTGK